VTNKNDDGVDKARHNAAIINFINSHSIVKTVILVSRWGSYIRGRWTKKGEEDLGGGHLYDDYGEYPGVQPKAIIVNIGLKRAVEKLLSMNCHVVLVTDVPEIGSM